MILPRARQTSQSCTQQIADASLTINKCFCCLLRMIWAINMSVPSFLPWLSSVQKEVADIQADSNISGYSHSRNNHLWLKC